MRLLPATAGEFSEQLILLFGASLFRRCRISGWWCRRWSRSLEFCEGFVDALFEVRGIVVDEAAEGGLYLHFAACADSIEQHRIEALAGQVAANVVGGCHLLIDDADDAVLAGVAQGVFNGGPKR